MKIAHIIGGPLAGGAELMVKNMALRTARDGHEVSVICVHDLVASRDVTGFGRQFVADLESAGVRVLYLGSICRILPFVGAFRLRRILRSNGADVLHLHTVSALLYLVSVPRTARRLLTLHFSSLGWRKVLMPLANYLVDGFITVCDAALNAHRKYMTRPVWRIYNGVDVTRFSCDRALQARLAPTKIISVGNLRTDKNHPVLLAALAKLKDMPGWECFVVGEGRERSRLEALCQRLGLDERVRFIGRRGDVPQLLCDADIFVMSSRQEGLPVALLEAMAAGLPAVVTDVGGCAEPLGGGSRWVVPPGDACAIADKLKLLVDDANLRYAVGKENQELVTSFSLDATTKAHVELYQRMVVEAQ